MFHRINLLLVISIAGLGITLLSEGSANGATVISQLTADRQSARQSVVIAQATDGATATDDSASPITESVSDQDDAILKVGSRGDRVSEVQEKLQQLGYYDDEPDGIFGVRTEAAVIEFQQQTELSDDGQVNPATFELLRKAIAPSRNAASSPSESTGEPSTSTAETPAVKDDQAIGTPAKSGRFWLLTTLIATSAVSGFALYKYTRPRVKRAASLVSIAPAAGNAIDYRNGTGHENGAGRSLNEPQNNAQNNAQTVISPTVITPSHESESSPTMAQASTNSVSTNEVQATSVQPDMAHSHGIAIHAEIAPVNETTRLAKVDIVDELVNDLRSPDSARRRKAIWELGQIGDSKAVQPLVDLMMDSDSSQRSLILASISEIGVRTLKPMNRALLLSLQDQSSDVRKNAIRDVTRVYDLVSQMSELLAHAASDPDAEVQETAQWALGQLGRIRSIPNMGNGTSLPSKNPEQLSGDV